MRTKGLSLGLVAMLVGCVRPHPPPAREDDPSIRFPNFFEHPALTVGTQGQPYELDGVTLQALMIAAHDLLPPGGEDRPCRDRLEAHRYRVIRQGDIVFVQIEDDDEFCGLKYLSLDTGARYAISTDGRILRRSVGTEPEEPPARRTPDAGLSAVEEPAPPQRESSAESQDGGTSPGRPEVPSPPRSSSDGGTPLGP